MNRSAHDHLKSFVERIERCEEEKKASADDIKDIYAEAKGNGFDVKALRTIIRMRKMDAAERQEHESIVATYAQALGMLADTPLGQAAIERASAPAKSTVTDLKSRSKARLRESMEDAATLSQQAADAGLISQEAAAETARDAAAVAKKFG